ncbi:MAG: hypothetical protein ACKO41_06485 [Sphingomonadales bacterium]
MRFLSQSTTILYFLLAGVIQATCFKHLNAQPLLYSVLAQQTTALSYGGDSGHPFSVAINPASVARIRAPRWAFGGEQRFLAPGWTEMAAALLLPSNHGAWGIFWGQEGLPLAVEQALKVTYAKAVSVNGSVGVTIGINRKKFGSFLAKTYPSAAAGFSCMVSHELQAAISFDHFSRRLTKYPAEKDLSVLRCLLAYTPTQKIALVSVICKQRGHAATRSFSLCYTPGSKTGIRVGFSGSPSLCWLGFMLGIGKKVVVQLHSGFYSLTGVSNGMSVYQTSPEKNNDLP